MQLIVVVSGLVAVVFICGWPADADELPAADSEGEPWVPSDGRTLDEWRRCHGMPADMCERVNNKKEQLKKLSASKSPRDRKARPSPTKIANDDEMRNETEKMPPSIPTVNVWPTEDNLDARLAERNGRTRKKRQLFDFDNFPSYKWTNPIVYKFDGNHTSIEIATIRNALQHIADSTCMRFTEIATNTQHTDHHIIFTNYGTGSGCYSYFGRVSFSPQPINIESVCLTVLGIPVELICLSIGLAHEHQRKDRDNYVDVLTENIDPEYEYNFGKESTMDVVPYHYGSLMHYSSRAFAASAGMDTLRARQPLYQLNMGQRVELTFDDAHAISIAYCNTTCSSSPAISCQRGGYQDPNNCTRCKCPDGFGGTNCERLAASTSSSCGGQLNLTATTPRRLTIQSPGYDSPGYYPSFTECSWMITAPTGYRIRLQFADTFGVLGWCYLCAWHWVEVKYKSDMGLEGARFCCDSRPLAVIDSETNAMMVLFKSNYSLGGMTGWRGFKAVATLVTQADISTALAISINDVVASVSHLYNFFGDPAYYATRLANATSYDDLGITVSNVSSSGGFFSALAVSYRQKQLYWCDNQHQSLDVGPFLYFSRSEAVALPPANLQGKGVAYDWLSGNVYYLDDATKTIGVVSTNADILGWKIVVSNLVTPRHIAVNPITRNLFWIDGSRIWKSNLAGGNKVILLTTTLVAPVKLAVDYTAQRLLWLDPSANKVGFVTFDGSSISTWTQTYLSYFSAITIHSRYIYLGFNDFAAFAVFELNGNSIIFRPPAIEFAGIGGSVSDLTMFSASTQPNGTGPCVTNNGGCSQFCFATSSTARVCDCNSGFNLLSDGVTCDSGSNECASSPCVNGGTCVDGVNRYTCLCVSGYTGTKCQTSIDINECTSSPCVNGGTCVEGVNSYTCTCIAGYTGVNCQTNINECSSLPCMNGATCVDGINRFTCTCVPGFAGDNCQTNINECSSSPCVNGATCVDAVNGYVCSCVTGFTGINCQTNINECSSLPCLNGGTCIDGLNRFTCSCVVGYIGVNCQININECVSLPCMNGATCVDGVNRYTCACVPGFAGDNCHTNINECSSSPCVNGGTCVDGLNGYTCSCVAGYTGVNCQININECSSAPCLNGGTCVDQVNRYSCTCPPGFNGLNCQTNIDDCSSGPCLNGGTCVDGVNSYVCSCVAGYTGLTCLINVNECSSAPCVNGGTCVDQVNRYSCTCPPGFNGLNCQTNINECSSLPCVNGGTCIDGANSYVCSCVAGFTGLTCQININECSSAPCLNGGTCVDGVNNFTCSCVAGYTGLTCQINGPIVVTSAAITSTSTSTIFTTPSTSRSSSASTASSSTDSATDPCSESIWGQRLNWNSLFGTVYPSISTLQDCLEACLLNVDCLAVDYDVANSDDARCWLHVNGSYKATGGTSAKVNQYTVKNRDCVPRFGARWRVFANQNSLLGVALPDVTNLLDCQRCCIAEQRCTAVDFVGDVTATNRCSLHVSGDSVDDNRRSSNGTWQYVVVDRYTDSSVQEPAMCGRYRRNTPPMN